MSGTDPRLNFDLTKRRTFREVLLRAFRRARKSAPELLVGVSPGRFRLWLTEERRRAKLFRRWAICFALLIVAAISTPKVVQYGKIWQARRIANEALALIDSRDFATADRKLRDAISLRPGEPRVALAAARLLSRTGEAGQAVVWWASIAKSPLLTKEDRRDYAAMALAITDLETAAQQIDLLTSQFSPSMPEDLLLAGQLAIARGLTDSALRDAEKVLTDSGARSEHVVAAAKLIFQADAGDGPDHALACRHLATLARDDSDPAALAALALLARQPLTSSAPSTLYSSPAVTFCDGAITLGEIADRLEHHPNSRGCDRVLAFEVRTRLEPARTDELISTAIDSLGGSDDQTLIALGAWLHSEGRFEQALKVVSSERANNKRELFIERVNALIALNRLSQVEELLLSESSIIDPASQHVYLAVVKSRTGEMTASRNEWDRALDSATTTQQLLMLADYAQKNGEANIADAAYDRAVIKQSSLRMAYVSHLMLAESMERTAKAHAIAVKITQLWPRDVTSQMHELYLRLLLDPSSDNAKTAEAKASAVLSENSRHLGARMVLALARLKMGRNADALDAISGGQPGEPVATAPLAVRAAALIANGWKDKALEESQKLAAVKLLPEERALLPTSYSGSN